MVSTWPGAAWAAPVSPGHSPGSGSCRTSPSKRAPTHADCAWASRPLVVSVVSIVSPGRWLRCSHRCEPSRTPGTEPVVASDQRLHRDSRRRRRGCLDSRCRRVCRCGAGLPVHGALRAIPHSSSRVAGQHEARHAGPFADSLDEFGSDVTQCRSPTPHLRNWTVELAGGRPEPHAAESVIRRRCRGCTRRRRTERHASGLARRR